MSHLKRQTLPIFSQILPCRDVSSVLTKEQDSMVKSVNSEARFSELESWLCHLPAV